MSLPGQQAGAVPGTVQQPAGGVPGAQATAVPGVVPGAAAPGAVPGAQAGTAGAQQPNKYSFFNRAPQDPALRFQGEGQSYRAKLIGIDPVPNSRGDKMCQEVILKQKSVVLASGLHKQRIIVNVSLNGIKLLDDDSKMVQFVHPVEKISFISRDTTDRRAFGYIVEGEKNKFHFFGIKTGNAAEGLVLALRDLFQVVYDIKQKEKNGGKQQDNKQQMENLQQGIEALNVDIGGGEQSDSLVAAPETATGATEVPAVAAASGGDDLGFLDVQVSSAQEIVEQQSQQNKMANIMGAFGSNPAAAPMPGMGGQNAFGSAANNMGMQQPAMVNSVSNNMMGQMSSMPSMGGAPPMGGAQVGGMMGGMGGIGGMGGMGGMAPPAQMGGMTAPTQAMSTPTMSATPAMSPMSPMSGAPSSSGSNTANAMGGKSDPFASLGALTGIAPKAAPTPQMSMNQQQQQQNNQFNQYMNNNVGAPASTGGNSMDALFG